jgi:hypothetical protein
MFKKKEEPSLNEQDGSLPSGFFLGMKRRYSVWPGQRQKYSLFRENPWNEAEKLLTVPRFARATFRHFSKTVARFTHFIFLSFRYCANTMCVTFS